MFSIKGKSKFRDIVLALNGIFLIFSAGVLGYTISNQLILSKLTEALTEDSALQKTIRITFSEDISIYFMALGCPVFFGLLIFLLVGTSGYTIKFSPGTYFSADRTAYMYKDIVSIEEEEKGSIVLRYMNIVHDTNDEPNVLKFKPQDKLLDFLKSQVNLYRNAGAAANSEAAVSAAE